MTIDDNYLNRLLYLSVKTESLLQLFKKLLALELNKIKKEMVTNFIFKFSVNDCLGK